MMDDSSMHNVKRMIVTMMVVVVIRMMTTTTAATTTMTTTISTMMIIVMAMMRMVKHYSKLTIFPKVIRPTRAFVGIKLSDICSDSWIQEWGSCHTHVQTSQKDFEEQVIFGEEYVQYRSKVTWQSLETRDARLDNFESHVASRVSNELAARLFLRRANPTNGPPLLCAVATFLLKRSTASWIESDIICISVFRTLQKY